MKIRNIREEEKAIFMEMAEDFYRPETGACLHGMQVDHLEATFLLCLRENPYARLLMAEDETGEAIGFCLLSLTWSNEVGGMVVWLEELYFRPQARGKGYAKQVLAWLEEEYSQAKRFRLEATHQNTLAIGLYREAGYEELPYYQMVKDRG